MSDRVADGLRQALHSRAEYAMTQTNTDRELARLHAELQRSRRSRRTKLTLAVTIAGAVAAGVLILVLAVTGGGTKNAQTTPANRPDGNGGAASTSLPSDYPLGRWTPVPDDHKQASLNFNDVGLVTLRDFVGQNAEPLTFPAPHLMRFGPSTDGYYCTTAATYRYAISRQRLTISPVGRDSCRNRAGFLQGRTWQKTG